MSFWNFKNISESSGELMLYGDLADDSWFGGDTISANRFEKELKSLGNVKNIMVRINSGGGDVFIGHAIYQMLKDHAAKITTKAEGLAASAASVALMSGDIIIVPVGAFVMIHNPSASTQGQSKDFTKMASTLEVIKNGIINIYSARTGKDKKVISQMMDDETWMTGEDAVREGFADSCEVDKTISKPILNGNTLITNGLSHDLSNIKTRPSMKNILDNKETTPPSIIDKVLEFFKGAPQAENFVKNLLDANITNITNIKEEEKDMEIKNVEELKKAYPDLVNQVVKTEVEAAMKTAVDDTLKSERCRIQDIEKIANRIDPVLVNKAKYETFIDAKDLAFEAMQTDNSKGKDYLKNLKTDTEDSGTEDVTASTTDIETAETKAAAENKAIENISNGANGSSRRGRK